MMKKLVVVRILLKVFLLISLVPIILIYVYGLKALIPILIYFQFLLLWAQVELSMRQHALAYFQSEPFFDVEKSTGGILYGNERMGFNRLIIKNISDWPAYNIMLSRIINNKFNIIMNPNDWKNWLHSEFIRCLPPHKEAELCYWSINDISVNLEDLVFEIIYFNRFGKIRSLTIMFRNEESIILSQERPPKPGFLLTTLEEFIMLLRFRQLFKIK